MHVSWYHIFWSPWLLRFLRCSGYQDNVSSRLVKKKRKNFSFVTQRRFYLEDPFCEGFLCRTLFKFYNIFSWKPLRFFYGFELSFRVFLLFRLSCCLLIGVVFGWDTLGYGVLQKQTKGVAAGSHFFLHSWTLENTCSEHFSAPNVGAMYPHTF